MKTAKRILMLALVALVAVGSANARSFRFGVKGGANFNKLHLTNMKENFSASNGTGWTLGVMTEFTVPIVGLNLDAAVMYARMNSEIDQTVMTGTSTTLLDTGSSKNFIDIPINLKYKFSLPVVGRWLSPYVYTGPDFAFKLGKSSDSLKSFQFGWNLGIGFEVFKYVQIGGGYCFGCNNIADAVLDSAGINASTTSDVKVRNNYWMVTAAVLF